MLVKSLSRPSFRSKIVNPSDDAARAAVAMRLDTRINRTDAVKSNVVSVISYTQTQDR